MKTNLYIRPRCSGKTTDLVKAFQLRNSNTNAIIVCHCTRRANDLKYMYPYYRKDIISIQQISSYLHSHNVDTIFIDEYFIMDNDYKLIFQLADSYNIEAIGTPIKQFSESNVRSVRIWWSLLKSKNFDHSILKDIHDMIEIYGSDLMFNLLVHPNCEVILPWQHNHKQFLSKQQYEMEIEGKIFK